MEDVWTYIKKLKRESESISGSGKNVTRDVFYQLPFFACTNNFIDASSQKDITKHLYCDETKTPPYPGAYGDIPNRWKEKHFLIKQALSILYNEKKQELKQKSKHGK